MVSAQDGMRTLAAAIESGEWTYSQGKPGDPRLFQDPRGGDCTDLCRYSVVKGVGEKWVGGTKAGTWHFRHRVAEGFTEVEAGAAQTGDIVVKGGHAGVLIGKDPDGNAWAWADGGRPSTSKLGGYRDGKTGAVNFTKSDFGPPGELLFFRPLER